MQRRLAPIRTLLCAAAFGLAGAPPAAALTIVDFDPALHNVYESGWGTANPVPNSDASFVGAGKDFSGVGFSGNFNVVLISDTYLAYAAHFPAVDNYEFYSPASGQTVTYYVNTSATVGVPNTDIRFAPIYQDAGHTIAGLNPADGITPYPIATSTTLGQFVGQDILVYGHGAEGTRLGVDVIEGIDPPPDFYLYTYTQGPQQGEPFLQSGDSGGPTFVVQDGQLVLAGIHYAIDPNHQPYPLSSDSFFAPYESDIDALGIGAQFTLIPEPAAISLGLTGLVCLAVWAAWHASRRNSR